MWPFSKKVIAPRTAPALPNEVLEAAILACKGDGVHMAVLYATMLGFQHELLREHAAINEFIALVQSPPAFTDTNIARAVSRVINDANVLCAGPSFETLVYGIQNNVNQHLRPLLEPYRLAVREFGAEQVFAEANFDVGGFLIRETLARREADLTAIYSKLDEKRPFLLPILLRARAKGRNKYGDIDLGDFLKEIVEFLQNYFAEDKLRFFYSYIPLKLCVDYVEPWLADAESALIMPADGIDFEYWCAARIEEQGWKVRVSKASGDQGIDIEAMRDGMLVAIQCKRYTSPIGNKSVQEAYTGAKHYRAGRAVVIGTGGYTRAAIELAANTGVLLLDAENIASFTSLVMEHGASVE